MQKRPTARLPIQLAANVVPLAQDVFVFDGMLAGWTDQQLSRGLARRTIDSRTATIHHFQEFCGTYPWEWTPQDLEDFSVRALSGPTPLSKSTLRGYQLIIRAFCDFITDSRYAWAQVCEQRFGQLPQQICHDWNTVVHLVEYEGKAARRALSYDELEALFAAADARVMRIQQSGHKGALAALRDAQLFKTIYAFGLRRGECIGLDVEDLRPNSSTPEFGNCGAVYVRFGKASRGSGPKRRTVLALPEFSWAVEGLRQWVGHGRPHYEVGPGGALWPTERGTRVSGRYLDLRFAELREDAGLPEELTVHYLRHTYVTNLLEWGYAERFVQDQVGHEYASTTSIYSSVGDDFKNRVIAQALDQFYGGLLDD